MKNTGHLKRLLIGFFVIWLACIEATFAVENSTEKLTKLLIDMQSFKAKFKQITLDGSGNSIQEMAGELAVQRPGMLYWKTNPPFEQLVISDGHQLWFYDPDLEQVTVQKLDPRITQTPALLLSGEVSTLQASYQISGEQINNLWVFVLIPKEPESLFEQLKLTFSDGELAQMHIKDSLGQRSSFEFFETQTDVEIAPELFHFTPPEGVDVITQ